MDDDRRQEFEILRRMTPRQKLDVMNGMLRQAVELKEAWLRSTEPDLDEREIRSKARNWWPVAAPDLAGVFVRPLEALGIPYMVTGGVAAVIYGDPRFTRDIDIVLRLAPEDAERFADAFDPEAFYVPPLETLREEAARRRHGHFNVIHRDSALRADVYVGGSDALHEWAFDRLRTLELDQGAIALAPPEYVIVRKLEYYRDSGSDRHLRDISMMLRLSADQIVEREIERWVDDLDLGAEWREAKALDVL